jgi:hypothetical protein
MEDDLDYILVDPVNSYELDFSDPLAEKMYVRCVNIRNQTIKKLAETTKSVNRKNYLPQLEEAKKSCRCRNESKKFMKALRDRRKNKISKSAFRHILYEVSVEKCDPELHQYLEKH